MQRPLGAIERYIWSGEQYAPLNGAMVADVQGVFDRAALESALLAVQRRHPLLRVGIDADGPRRRFSSAGIGAIPLTLQPADDPDSWREATAELLAGRFTDPRRPLVRATVVTRADGFHLIIGGSHLIADALSALQLLVDVLQAMSAPDRAVEPLPELPPLEQLIPPSIAAQLARQTPPAPMLAPESLAVAPAEAMPPATARTQLTCWHLPEAAVRALLERCRQEQVTVQNGICALLVRALVRLDGEVARPRRLQVPVNIRERLGVDERHYGMFITLVGMELAAREAPSPWQLARRGQQLLAAQLEDAPVFATLAHIQAMAEPLDDAQFLAAFGGRGQAPWDLSVNNLGRVPAPQQYGPYRVAGFWGPVLNVGGFETIFGIHTFAGRMALSVSNGDAGRAAALREAFGAELREQLSLT